MRLRSDFLVAQLCFCSIFNSIDKVEKYRLMRSVCVLLTRVAGTKSLGSAGCSSFQAPFISERPPSGTALSLAKGHSRYEEVFFVRKVLPDIFEFLGEDQWTWQARSAAVAKRPL